MQLKDVKRRSGASRRDAAKDDIEFSGSFLFSNTEVAYDEAETSVIMNAKKAIVESFLLPRHVSFKTDIWVDGSMSAVGEKKVNVVARRDKEDDSSMIDIGMRFILTR